MVIVIPVIFFTRTNDVFEINKMFTFRFFTILIVAMWALSVIRDKKILLLKTDFDFPLLGFLAVCLVTTVVTKNIYVSVFGVYEDFEGIFTMINYFFLYYIIANYASRQGMIYKILATIIIATFIISLYGLLQNSGWDFVRWNPDTYSPDRFFSTLGNPNFLAAYLVESIPVLFILFFVMKDNLKKLVILGVLLASIAVLFLTKSRAGFLSFLVTIFLIAVYSFIDSRKKENRLFKDNVPWFIAFGALIVITMFIPVVQDAFKMLWERSKSLLTFKGVIMTPRLYIWKSALAMFRDFPVLGTGIDTFQVIFPYYRFPIYWQLEWNGTPEKTHNVFLQVLATQGIAGFSFYMLLVFSFFKKSFNIIFREKQIIRRYITFGIFMAVIAYFIQGMFNYTVVAYGFMFYMGMGLIIVLDTSKNRYHAYNFSEGARALLEKHGKTAGIIVLVAAAVLQVYLVRYWTADLFFKVGNIAVANNRADLSLGYYDRAVRLNPDREIYWVKYGIGYEKVMRSEHDPSKKLHYIKQALAVHKRTIEMNPMNGYNFNNTARVLKHYGEAIDPAKYDDAIKMYNEAIKRDPNNAYFGLDLATVYINRQEWEKALNICKRYNGLYPDFATPLSYMGYIYMLQGKDKIELARTYYEQAVDDKYWHRDVVTESSTYSNLGIIYVNMNRITDGIEMFQKVVALRPEYSEGYLNLGKLYTMIGRDAQAVEMYEKALAINPGDARASEPLKILRKKVGK